MYSYVFWRNTFTGLSIAMLASLVAAEQSCGNAIDYLSARIVGGSAVEQYTYPWYVLFTNIPVPLAQGLQICGGALITSRYVLTAAHCVYKKTLMFAFIGAHNICLDHEEHRQAFKISEYIPHERFSHTAAWYDIGLAKLESNAIYEPICLPSNADLDLPESGDILGFGALTHDSAGSCKMQQVTLDLHSTQQCGLMVSAQDVDVLRNTTEPKNAFCAGNILGGVDACQGDSGGPMQAENRQGQYVLHGIISFGFGCAQPEKWGVYTDVRKYLNWISAKVDIDIEFVGRS